MLNDGGSDSDSAMQCGPRAASMDSAARDYIAHCDSDESGVARSAFAAPSRERHVDELWGGEHEAGAEPAEPLVRMAGVPTRVPARFGAAFAHAGAGVDGAYHHVDVISWLRVLCACQAWLVMRSLTCDAVCIFSTKSSRSHVVHRRSPHSVPRKRRQAGALLCR